MTLLGCREIVSHSDWLLTVLDLDSYMVISIVHGKTGGLLGGNGL